MEDVTLPILPPQVQQLPGSQAGKNRKTESIDQRLMTLHTINASFVGTEQGLEIIWLQDLFWLISGAVWHGNFFWLIVCVSVKAAPAEHIEKGRSDVLKGLFGFALCGRQVYDPL